MVFCLGADAVRSKTAPILCLFDFPSYREEAEGLPLANREERRVFADLLIGAGFDIDDVTFCSLSDQSVGSISSINAKKAFELGSRIRAFIELHPRTLIITFGARAAHALGISDAKPMQVSHFQSERFGNSIPVIHSLHSYRILSGPDATIVDVQRDLRFAHSVLTNSLPSLSYNLFEIDEPKKILTLQEWICDTTKLAFYDHETPSLNYLHPKFALVSTAMDWDVRDEKDVPIVAFWAGYHNMKPVHDQATMDEFYRLWREFYMKVGHDFELGGHNCKFDDRCTYNYFKIPEFSSKYDSRYLVAVVNSETDNGLKSNVERYLGIPRYDDEVDKIVAEIAGRRTRSAVLTEEDDIRAMEWFGVEPIVKETKRHGRRLYWNPELDRKTWAWGMLPMDILRHYNCLDALLTRRLSGRLFQVIDEEGLTDSFLFRMRMDAETRVPEDRGLVLDIEMCKSWVVDCQRIEAMTHDRMNRFIEETYPNSELFYTNKITAASPPNGKLNPNSPKQVCAALFGEPVQLPTYDVNMIANQTIVSHRQTGIKFPWFDSQTGVNLRRLKTIAEQMHRQVYQIISKIEPGEAATRENFIMDYQELRAIGPNFEPAYFEKKLQDLWWEQFGMIPALTTVTAYPFGSAIPQVFTKSGAPSTRRADLELIYRLGVGDPDFLAAFTTYRRANKLRTSFLEKFLSGLREDGTVAPGYNVTGARGGRISSSAQKNINTGFNAQNLNKNVRGLFKSRQGKVIFGWDLGQIEVRVLAAVSQDAKLLAAVRNTSYDIHRMTTADILGIDPEQVTKDQRQIGKLTVFAVLYGVSAQGLAAILGIPVSDAEIIIENFFVAYPDVRRYMLEMEEHGRTYGYVKTLLGTRRWLRDLKSIDAGVRGHAARVASNAPIQGTAGEFCFDRIFAIQDMAREEGCPSIDFWSQVHDYAGFEMDGRVLEPNEEPDPNDWAWCRKIRPYTSPEDRAALEAELKARNANFPEELDYEFGGRILEIAERAFNDPNIWEPLNTVPILYDPYIKPVWDNAPNLLKAVDPNYDKAEKRLIPAEVFATFTGEADDDDFFAIDESA